MPGPVTRRDLLAQLGVTAAATFGASAAGIGFAGVARAQEKPKGNIPDKPYRIGHMTFFTGPGAVLGEPMFKGQQLAADEINAAGGLLGKRKRSEEHTSELQSQSNLVCRLLLEKKKNDEQPA